MKKNLVIFIVLTFFETYLSGQQIVSVDSTGNYAKRVNLFNTQKAIFEDSIKYYEDLARPFEKSYRLLDHRGLWLNMAFGLTRSHKTMIWTVDEECDCEGNEISADTSVNLAKNRWSQSINLGFEYRITQKWGMRIGGSYSRMHLSSGSKVMDINGSVGKLTEAYRFQQKTGSAALMYYHRHKGVYPNFHTYFGAGASMSDTRIDGGFTNNPVTNINDEGVPYTTVPANIKRRTDNGEFNFNAFAGLRYEGGKIQGFYEIGLSPALYHQIGVAFPLSTGLHKARKKYMKNKETYYGYVETADTYRVQIGTLERQMFPERFPVPVQVVNTGDSESSSSDGGGGGRSGGSNCTPSSSSGSSSGGGRSGGRN
jgi:uncharacterized membrane protein YgcG